MENFRKKKGLLWLFLVVFIVLNTGLAVSVVFSHSPDIRGNELHHIYAIQSVLLDNSNLYRNPEQFPYTITPKSPFFYILCDAVLSAFHVRPGTDIVSVYAICRGISFLCALAILGCIFHISHRILQFDVVQSVLVLNLSLLVTFPWFYVARPDACLSLYYWGTILCVLEYWNRRSTGPIEPYLFLVGAGVCSVFAFFSKQNGVVIWGIVAAFLLLKQQFKGCLWYLTGVAVGGVVAGLCYLPYASAFFWKNVFDGLKNGISLNWAFKQCYYDLLTIYSVLTFSGIIAALYLVKKTVVESVRRKHVPIQFLFFCYAAFFAVAVVTGLKVGSAINYFNDVLILSLLLICIALHYAARQGFRYSGRISAVACSVMVAFGMCISIHHYSVYSWKNLQAIYNGRSISLSEQQLLDFLQEEIEEHPDLYFFSEIRHINNFFPGHAVFPELGISEQATHALDYSHVQDDVRQGKIHYYITPTPIHDIFYLTKQSLELLRDSDVEEEIIQQLKPLKWTRFEKNAFLQAFDTQLGTQADSYAKLILDAALQYRLFNVELETYFSLYQEFGQIKLYRYHERISAE